MNDIKHAIQETTHDHVVAGAAAKAAPPVGVSTAYLAGVPVSDLVLWLTAFYLILQIAYLLWRWHRDRKSASREDKENGR